MLPLLQYWISSRVNKVLMLCKFQATTSHYFFHVKWNFDEIDKKLLPNKAMPITLLNLSTIHWSLSKNMTQEQTTRSELNPMQSSRSESTTCPRKGVCSDLNWTAQRLQMVANKSLEMMLGVILNQLKPKFAAKSVANEMWCLKAM